MKNTFQTLLVFALTAFSLAAQSQVRYLEEVFANVTVDTGIAYAQNYEYFTGFASLQPLKMDVYRPAGDVATDRPVILLSPNGNFLSRPFNQLLGLCFSFRKDSSIVELCKRFAKRGYVAVAFDYRAGWNATSTDQITRTKTYLQAIYRGMQDAKALVRYFKNDFANGGNQWGIDTSKVVIGGSNSGAYVALAASSLNDLAEINNDIDFVDPNGPFIKHDTIGDFEGFGGTQNYDNYPGISSRFQCALALGGAVGDTSWIQRGETPIIAFHGTDETSTKYNRGVITTATGAYVIYLHGSGDFMPVVEAKGNNDVFKPNSFVPATPPNRDSGGVQTVPVEGLYPFYGRKFEPWNWYDATCFNASSRMQALTGLTSSSAVTAKRYIDTIMGYSSPRLYQLLYGAPQSLSVSLGSSATVCSGSQITLNPAVTGGTGPYSYLWSFTGNSLSCNNCHSPLALITQNSTYSVTVTDANSATVSASVTYTSISCGGNCIIDTTNTSLIYPVSDSLPCIVRTFAQSKTVQFYVPVTIDLQDFGAPFPFILTVDSFVLTDVSGFPTGFAKNINPAGTVFYPGSHGCMSIAGMTTDPIGLYPLSFSGYYYMHGAPFPPFFDGDTIMVADALINAYQGKTYSLNVINPGSPCGSVVSIGLGSNQAVCNGTAITLTPNVSGGTSPYTYLWSSTGNSLNCNNCQNPTATITQNSSFSVTVTDVNSTTASASVSYTVGSGNYQITPSGSTIFCQGGSVTLNAGGGYISYQWSNGATASSINVSQGGTYSVTVLDSGGCTFTDSEVVTVSSPTPQSIIGNPSITPFQTYPYLVNATGNTSYDWTVAGGAIQSGQGTNSVNVIWGNTGPYQVTLVRNVGGCSDTSILLVVSSSCSLTVNVLTSAASPLCSGDDALLIAQIAQPSTYQWVRNGSALAGETNDTLVVSSSGTYQVQVTSGSCTVITNGNVLNFQSVPSVPLITSNAGNNTCITQAVTLTANAGYQSYSWNTGSTNDSVTVTLSGSYTVTVTGANGCSEESLPYNLNLSIVSPNQVCVVSVDSASGKNVVIWEKPNTAGVDSYFVYKETNQFNVYSKAGALGVNEFSTFIDMNSNPQQQADRYNLAVLDTCGNVTLQSDAHKTIHLTINSGLGGVWNLIWSHYEGFIFPSYNIYRGTQLNGLQLVTTISSGNNSYTDVNPPSLVTYYQIEAENPIGCVPTAKTASFSSSRSNIVQVQGTGTEDMGNDFQVLLYPNPATNTITLSINESMIGSMVVITDVTGRKIAAVQLETQNTTLETADFASGVYVAEITLKSPKGNLNTRPIRKRWVKM